jgi:2-amino-4-hydroxy-6-hydroxymethyldihydropteridine diphosphokinase
MNTVIIGIGSNISPEENIQRAVEELEKSLRLIKMTGWVKTTPVGLKEQPDFLNGAVKAETLLEMDSLRSFLKQMEDRLGRDRTLPKSGPRTIDLDIVVWNGEIVDPDYYTRDFLRSAVNELL